MTALSDLQAMLSNTGRYYGRVDGKWGPMTEAAILKAMEDGPDTALTANDYAASASRLGCKVSHIRAVAEVEAAGAGFSSGLPKILPERHIFSRLTKGRFDKSHPELSYPRWGTLPYPKSQIDRYQLLLRMAHLDVEAGFAACSYGKFQILGQHHLSCGYGTSWAFAFAMARDEQAQLHAFEEFLQSEGLVGFLRAGTWALFAKHYNGSAYRLNRYDVRLAEAAFKYAQRA